MTDQAATGSSGGIGGVIYQVVKNLVARQRAKRLDASGVQRNSSVCEWRQRYPLLRLIKTLTSAATCCDCVDDKADGVTVKMFVLAEAKCWNRRNGGRSCSVVRECMPRYLLLVGGGTRTGHSLTPKARPGGGEKTCVSRHAQGCPAMEQSLLPPLCGNGGGVCLVSQLPDLVTFGGSFACKPHSAENNQKTRYR
jgi:hypothetical protein